MIRKFIIFALINFIFILNGFSQNYEYIVKAGFIHKIVGYTTWPYHTIQKEDFFNILIIGNNPFNSSVFQIYENEKINEKPVRITVLPEWNDNIKINPQVIFICTSESSSINPILENWLNKPVLIFGDTDGYCQKGVMVNFFLTKEETVRFEINLKSLKNSGLSMNPQLITVSVLVK